MARRAKRPNDRLRQLISEAGLSHKGFARRVNDAGGAYGTPCMSYDHSSVQRWLGGQQPRSPTPDLIAEVLTARVGRKVTPADMGMQPGAMPPDIGLSFGLTLHDSLHTVTSLWEGDLLRRSFLVGAGYAAGAFVAPAMRWLTAPADGRPVPER